MESREVSQHIKEEAEEVEDGPPPGWQSISPKKEPQQPEEEVGPPPGFQSNPVKQEKEEEEHGAPPGLQSGPVEVKPEATEEEAGAPPGLESVPVKEVAQPEDDDDGPPPGWEHVPPPQPSPAPPQPPPLTPTPPPAIPSGMSRRSRASSSSAPSVPGMDTCRFQTVNQFQNYVQNFQNRPLRKEAEVVLIDFLGHPVLRYFDQLGWINMLSLHGQVNVSWVKEFYANMDLSQSSDFSLHTWVRGSHIVITPDIWSEFIGIARPTHPVYPFALLGDDAAPVHYDLVAAFLTRRAYEWPSGYIPYTLLQPEFRLLNLIVCHTIEPRGHHTDINQKRGYVLYAIANNLHIDLPAFMVMQMFFTAGSARSAGIPFGVLITRYLASRHVPTFANDSYVEVRKKINAQTVNLSEAHMPQAHVVPRPVYVDETLTIGERMENLEAVVAGGFEYMQQEFTGIHGELHTLTASMDRMQLETQQSNVNMAEMLEWIRRQMDM